MNRIPTVSILAFTLAALSAAILGGFIASLPEDSTPLDVFSADNAFTVIPLMIAVAGCGFASIISAVSHGISRREL